MKRALLIFAVVVTTPIVLHAITKCTQPSFGCRANGIRRKPRYIKRPASYPDDLLTAIRNEYE